MGKMTGNRGFILRARGLTEQLEITVLLLYQEGDIITARIGGICWLA